MEKLENEHFKKYPYEQLTCDELDRFIEIIETAKLFGKRIGKNYPSVREFLFSPGFFKFKLFLEAGNGRHWERGFDTLTFQFDQLGSKSDSRIVGAFLRLTQLTQNLLIVIRMFISDPALRCPTQFPPKPQKSP